MKRLKTFFVLLTLVFSFLFFLAILGFAQWSTPPGNPPNPNVPPPINIGSSDQWKDGRLGVGTQTQGIYWLADVGNSLYFQNRNLQTTMVLGENGNLGLGATDPATRLEVRGGALCVRSGTSVSCNTTSGAISAQYFYYISDLTLKRNIHPIENALSRLLTLQGISYQPIYDRTHSLGLIAQEVEKVFPEVVNTDKETGLKWIDYGKLVPVLIEAIKEQQKEIEKLKAEIESLKGR